MNKLTRNILTFVVAVSGGIYTGEHMPEAYYYPIRKYIPTFK